MRGHTRRAVLDTLPADIASSPRRRLLLHSALHSPSVLTPRSCARRRHRHVERSECASLVQRTDARRMRRATPSHSTLRSTSATSSMMTASAPTQGWRRVTMRLRTLPTRTLRPCSSALTRLPPTLRRIPSRGCASSTCRIRRADRCDARRSSTAPRPAMHSCRPATRRRALRVTEWGARPCRPSVACHHPYRLDQRGAAIARMDPSRSIHR